MKDNFHFVRLGLPLALTLVSSCTRAKPVAEADYGAKIVGNWRGTVGNMKESITFNVPAGGCGGADGRGWTTKHGPWSN